MKYFAKLNKTIGSKYTYHAISDNPAFSGEMIMKVTFTTNGTGTRVTFLFTNIPPGIRPEDNKTGTRMTLEKLARYVEGKGRV